MRSLVTLFIAVTFFGTSIAEDQMLDLYQGCWKSNLPDDGITNTIAPCIDGASAEAVIFYPNREDTPTTCRGNGRFELTCQRSYWLLLSLDTWLHEEKYSRNRRHSYHRVRTLSAVFQPSCNR